MKRIIGIGIIIITLVFSCWWKINHFVTGINPIEILIECSTVIFFVVGVWLTTKD